MNSAAGSALIAGILSGVFVIVGVLLGTWLQGRSTDREHERAAAATRDEILAALGAAVITLLTQAEVWHHTAARRRNLTQVPGNLAELTGGPPDPRAIQLAGELERLRHAMIPVTNEISLYTIRLNLSDPALRPQVARLMAAVRAIVANMEGMKTSSGISTTRLSARIVRCATSATSSPSRTARKVAGQDGASTVKASTVTASLAVTLMTIHQTVNQGRLRPKLRPIR